jgi:hypothetical protein
MALGGRCLGTRVVERLLFPRYVAHLSCQDFADVLEFLPHVKNEPDRLRLILGQLNNLEQILIAKVHINRGLGQFVHILDLAFPASNIGQTLVVFQDQVGAFLDAVVFAFEGLEDELAVLGGGVFEDEAVGDLLAGGFLYFEEGQVRA